MAILDERRLNGIALIVTETFTGNTMEQQMIIDLLETVIYLKKANEDLTTELEGKK